jgi:hypothetical protein
MLSACVLELQLCSIMLHIQDKNSAKNDAYKSQHNIFNM